MQHQLYSLLAHCTILRLPSTREQRFDFNAPGHCLVRVRLLHCMHVRLCNGYTRAYAQIMQHTHTHKAVTGRVEVKKLLSRGRQSNYSLNLFFMLNPKIVIADYKILSFSTNFAWKSAELSVFTQHQWLTLISGVCSSILL